MRKTICHITDIHSGFRYALMKPGVIVFDETEEGQLIPYHPKLTAWQEYLWKLFTNGIEALKRFAGDDEIFVIHNGDLSHGNKHQDAWVSTRIADQIIIAAENMHELAKIDNVTMVRISQGTGAHNFSEGSSEILVTRELQREYPKKDIAFVKHGFMNYNGIDIDYAHHGPPSGSRNWLKGNVARYYLRSLMMDDRDHDKKPPDLVLRGHIHIPVDETVTVGKYKSRLIVGPSFCAINDFAQQVGRSPSYVTNGMSAIEVIDGDIVRVKDFYQTVDVRRRELT